MVLIVLTSFAAADPPAPVAFKPGDHKSKLAPRFSPKGTQIALAPAELLGLAGKDHLVGRIPLGAKSLRGEGQKIALARTEAGKPYDLLFIDADLDGDLAEEKPVSTKSNLTRGNWWSSFSGELKAVHANSGPEAAVPYPSSFWTVVAKPDETPKIIRYTRRGF
ncbi:MAG TPA: hypothetical protein VNC50_18475, partial [Planctomycetia bacterium]|nr:hypothetical protein [Planctomycetia bacterium]